MARVGAVRQQQAGAARTVAPAAAVVVRQQAQEAEVVTSVTESPGRRSARLQSASKSPEKKARRDLPSEETKSPEKKARRDLPSEETNSGKEAVELSSSAIEDESQGHVLVESVPALEEEAQDAEDHVRRRLRSREGSLAKNYTEDPDDNEDPDIDNEDLEDGVDSDEGAKTPGKTLPVLQRLKKGRQMKPFSPQGSPCYHLVFCICLMSHTLSFSSYLRQQYVQIPHVCLSVVRRWRRWRRWWRWS